MKAFTTAATDTARLLDRLLALYWADGVTQGQAAVLLGMRKADFAEFADLKLGERALARVANEYLAGSFNAAFPHCDPAAHAHARHATAAARPCDWSRKPSRRDCILLTPPQRQILRELVPRTNTADPELSTYLKSHPIPLWRRFRDPDDDSGTGSDIESLKCA
jgi:hypothetical protein